MLEIFCSSAVLPCLPWPENSSSKTSLPGGIPAQDTFCQQTAISSGTKFVIFHQNTLQCEYSNTFNRGTQPPFHFAGGMSVPIITCLIKPPTKAFLSPKINIDIMSLYFSLAPVELLYLPISTPFNIRSQLINSSFLHRKLTKRHKISF